MLPKRGRIRASIEIKDILKRGKRFSSPGLSLTALRKNSGPFRALVICSRKVDKRSTRRNRIKRRIREVLRRDIGPLLPHADVVVVVRPGGGELSARQIKDTLFNVLSIS